MALPESAAGEGGGRHRPGPQSHPSHTHFPNGVFVRRASGDAPGPAPSSPSAEPPPGPGHHLAHLNHCSHLLPLLKTLPVSLRTKALVTKKGLLGPAPLAHSALPHQPLHCSLEPATHHPASGPLHWLFPLRGCILYSQIQPNGLLFQVLAGKITSSEGTSLASSSKAPLFLVTPSLLPVEFFSFSALVIP